MLALGVRANALGVRPKARPQREWVRILMECRLNVFKNREGYNIVLCLQKDVIKVKTETFIWTQKLFISFL